MEIAFLIFVLFPILDFLTSKLLWYMFMVSGSLQSFQGFFLEHGYKLFHSLCLIIPYLTFL